jgi:hypothetical protein
MRHLAHLTADRVFALRKEVNFPPESRIPDLVDLDLVTVSS